MKKIVCTLLIIAMLASILCVTAFAAGGDEDKAGIYAVSVESAYTSTVTVTPLKADGSAPTVNSTKQIDSTTVTLYEEAVKLSVQYTTTTSGQYMVFVLKAGETPTKDNIVYINQDAADGSKILFSNVYPSTLSNGETYNIYLSNSTLGYKKVASFKYFEPYMLGDVDLNGTVNAIDAGLILQKVVQIVTLDSTQLKAGDVNKDGNVNAIDAGYILQKVVKLIEDFEEVQVK